MPFYPKTGGGAAASAGTWTKYSLDYTQFNGDAVASASVVVAANQKSKVILGSIIRVLSAFSGTVSGGLSKLELGLGTSDEPLAYAEIPDASDNSLGGGEMYETATLQDLGLILGIDPPGVAAFFGPGQVAGMTTDVTPHADNVGVIGNSILLEFDGVKTLADVQNDWNTANPDNTFSFTGGDDDTQVPDNGTSIQLSGGVNNTYVGQDLLVTLTSVSGLTLDNLSAGAIELWVLEAALPPAEL